MKKCLMACACALLKGLHLTDLEVDANDKKRQDKYTLSIELENIVLMISPPDRAFGPTQARVSAPRASKVEMHAAGIAHRFIKSSRAAPGSRSDPLYLPGPIQTRADLHFIRPLSLQWLLNEIVESESFIISKGISSPQPSRSRSPCGIGSCTWRRSCR